MIQKLVEITDLSPLAIETGILLFLTVLFIVVVFLVLAILRIKNELIKMSYTMNYIARLLERGYKSRKLHKVNYDPETEDVVLEMLQQGISHSEIRKTIPVSKEYIEMIESVATAKGLLAPKPDVLKTE